MSGVSPSEFRAKFRSMIPYYSRLAGFIRSSNDDTSPELMALIIYNYFGSKNTVHYLIS
jgi:hypothetical protein